MSKKGTKKKVGKMKDVLGEFFTAFGTALIAGAVISLSITETKYWDFFGQGFVCLMLGIYIKLSNVKDVNEKRIKRIGKLTKLLGILTVSIFLLSALLLFITNNFYGAISLIIILVFFVFFSIY